MALSQISVRGGNQPIPFDVDEDNAAIFSNNGPDTVYYGTTRSVTAATGTPILSGETATLTGTTYLVVANTLGALAKVSITDTEPDDSGGTATGTVGVFEPNHFYAAGSLIVQDGVTQYATSPFTSAGSYDAADWTDLPFDLAGPSPSDGETLIYDSGTGLVSLQASPQISATGPGGAAGGDSGTTITLPDPLASDGYGLYHMKLTGNCTATMPAPTVGSRFVLRATQDATGSRTLSFAASPAVIFPGVPLSLNSTAGADNWISFECALDGSSNPTWYGFPATSSVTNLSDIADVDAARNNLKVAVLRGCLRVSTTNITLSGLSTIDGHAYIDGERHLVTGQTAGAENGPWVVHSGAWTRPTDYVAGAQYASGKLVPVRGGTYAHSVWMLSNDATVTVGTTASTWIRVADGSTAAAEAGTFWLVVRAAARITSSAAAGTTYLMSGATAADVPSVAASATGAAAITPITIGTSDYAAGTKLRVRATLRFTSAVNRDVKVALFPVLDASTMTLDGANMVTGSDVTLSPGASTNTKVSGTSAEFDVPANDDYAIGYQVLVGAPSASCSLFAALHRKHN